MGFTLGRGQTGVVQGTIDGIHCITVWSQVSRVQAQELIHQSFDCVDGTSNSSRHDAFAIEVGQQRHEGCSVDHFVYQHLSGRVQQPNLTGVGIGQTLIAELVNRRHVDGISTKTLVVGGQLLISTVDNLVPLSNHILGGSQQSSLLVTWDSLTHPSQQSRQSTTSHNTDTGLMNLAECSQLRADTSLTVTTLGIDNRKLIIHTGHGLSELSLKHVVQLTHDLLRTTGQLYLIVHSVRSTGSSHLIHTQVHITQDSMTSLNPGSITASTAIQSRSICQQVSRGKGSSNSSINTWAVDYLGQLQLEGIIKVQVRLHLTGQLRDSSLERLQSVLHRVTQDGFQSGLVSSTATLTDVVQREVDTIEDEHSTFGVLRILTGQLDGFTITATDHHGGDTFHPSIGRSVNGRSSRHLVIQ